MSQLRIGSRIRLWPKDTYAKYGIVREINASYILVQLTEKDPQDHCRYQVGDIIKLPSRGLQVLTEKEFRERYC